MAGSMVLSRLYASSPVDDYIIYALELRHLSFDGGAIRLCQGFDDVVVVLENAESATFLASGFEVSLPKRAMRGKQDLQFQLDNVSGEAVLALDAAIEMGGPIQVILRTYTASDLSAPAQPPVVMTAVAVKVNIRSVVVVASFHDLVNKAWPVRRYTPSFAPGLKYFG